MIWTLYSGESILWSIGLIALALWLIYEILNTLGTTMIIDETGMYYKSRFKKQAISWSEVERIEYDSGESIRCIGKYHQVNLFLQDFQEDEQNIETALEYIRAIQPTIPMVETMNNAEVHLLKYSKRGLLIFTPCVVVEFFLVDARLVIFCLLIGMLVGLYQMFRLIHNPRMKKNFIDHLIVGWIALEFVKRPWKFINVEPQGIEFWEQILLAITFVYGLELILAMTRGIIERKARERGLFVEES